MLKPVTTPLSSTDFLTRVPSAFQGAPMSHQMPKAAFPAKGWGSVKTKDAWRLWRATHEHFDEC